MENLSQDNFTTSGSATQQASQQYDTGVDQMWKKIFQKTNTYFWQV